ncbi:MAG: bifunctional 5,10-methylene-tetrahydrofolate dehydrogenase/5,10-methylene-tetrahydrofolate cyclohydrolase [Dehalococcoidia bacterium]|nr:bifunctional 5,10-methylene-tetrahydrofolate dehydrogenase/5,10-methylene-tetrahydrofolate cyclohydrolase [Dehalococcoidia bacterium]
MTARIIDGAAIAAEIRAEVARDVEALVGAGRPRPHLTAVLVGDDPASISYVRGKRRDCDEVGFSSETLRLPSETTQDELVAHIERLNRDPGVHGMIAQVPLPPHIDEAAIMEAIDPAKDADGLTPTSLGRLLQGQPRFVPATPQGVQQLLVRSGIDPAGQRVVIVGRSLLVGRPLAMLLSMKAPGANATVTVAHTGTRDLASVTREADILIPAVGRPRTITADMVRPGATVIDVGVNRVDDASKKAGYRLVGDVDFEAVAEVAGAITKVPGGVGPMTRAMLLVNTLRAAQASG